MEITCNRCRQTVQAEDCYCPACGLPQFQYSAENDPGLIPPEKGAEAVRDASVIAWKPALRMALMLAIPAGILSSRLSPAGNFGLFWLASAALWAVVLYMRSQRPAWITIGAGARIGLVTGLLAGWLAFSISGGTLFVQRFVLHQASRMDAEWKANVDANLQASQQITQQWAAGMGTTDAAQAQAVQVQFHTWMLSPEGHAGIEAFGSLFNVAFLILFAVLGGILGARLLARSRRPEV